LITWHPDVGGDRAAQSVSGNRGVTPESPGQPQQIASVPETTVPPSAITPGRTRARATVGTQ
jgi:hypothetical protein